MLWLAVAWMYFVFGMWAFCAYGETFLLKYGLAMCGAIVVASIFEPENVDDFGRVER